LIYFLVRDQEVDGSNPFAPITYREFQFFVYTGVDDFVEGQSLQVRQAYQPQTGRAENLLI